MQPVMDPAVPDFVNKLQRIDTYDEIEEIMKSQDFVMAGADERFIFLEDTLIMAEGEQHSELTRLFAPLMSRQAVAYYELQLVEPAIQDSIAEMTSTRGEDGKVRADVVPLIHAALTRISARVTGVDGVDSKQATERFRDMVLAVSAATTASYSSATNPGAIIQKGKDALQALADEWMQASLDRRIALAKQHKAG